MGKASLDITPPLTSKEPYCAVVVIFIPLFAEQWMVASTFCFLTDDVEEEDFFFFLRILPPTFTELEDCENGVLRRRTQRISSS